jgi:hypothetical protein
MPEPRASERARLQPRASSNCPRDFHIFGRIDDLIFVAGSFRGTHRAPAPTAAKRRVFDGPSSYMK